MKIIFYFIFALIKQLQGCNRELEREIKQKKKDCTVDPQSVVMVVI